MLLQLFLLFVVFGFIVLLIGMSWESWVMSALSTVLFFILAVLSMMVEIPYCGSTYVFSDYAGSIIFFVVGIFTAILSFLFKLADIAESFEEHGEKDETSVV